MPWRRGGRQGAATGGHLYRDRQLARDNDNALNLGRVRRGGGATAAPSTWVGSQVGALFMEVGLGHDWSCSTADDTSEMPDATRMLWRFFRSHAL